MAAYDSGNPHQKVYTDMTISVRRNINSPVFQETTKEVTILGNTQLGATVFTVSARDDDKVRSPGVFYNQL